MGLIALQFKANQFYLKFEIGIYLNHSLKQVVDYKLVKVKFLFIYCSKVKKCALHPTFKYIFNRFIFCWFLTDCNAVTAKQTLFG